MKAIIPLAGLGTRLRPHTHTRPKPLVHVAGKTVLGHIIERLKDLDIDEIIFITGHMDEKIKEHARDIDYSCKFIMQEKLEGDGAAILLAKDEITEGDCIVVFVDTLFETDLKPAIEKAKDALVWVKEVEDPSRFGVAVLEDGRITRIVEKPSEPISNLALIGLYYFKDAPYMMEKLSELRDKKITSKGEYRLADALGLMIEDGKDIAAQDVKVWADCGKPETLLETNRWLLESGHTKKADAKNSSIIDPVYIEDGAQIEDSVIGPYVSVAKGTSIKGSIIRNSIINEDARIENSNLEGSLIGEKAKVMGKTRRLSVGDDSEIEH